MLALAVTAAVAIVTGDQVALRASPDHDSARQAVLYRGDWLEVRGEKRGYLKVYDHRHERPGYVAESRVHVYTQDAATAPELHAVVEFLRDTTGQESLGIAYAALFLKVAPNAQIGPDVFDALGTMADRLARRASGANVDASLAAHLEVAQSYGVKFVNVEQGGHVRVCYDGEGFQHVLAQGGSPEAKARAVLALTDGECVDPALPISEVSIVDAWRARVMDQVDPAAVPGVVANKLRLRRAQIQSALAYEQARHGDGPIASRSAGEAIHALALVDKRELSEDDEDAYAETAVHVAAMRWAVLPEAAPLPGVSFHPGEPGQTCVTVTAAQAPPVGEARRGPPDQARSPLIERCTYGLVWRSSLKASPSRTAFALAVQPLPGWVELWVFRKVSSADGGWIVDVVAPSTDDPSLGYAELAGWSPDSTKALVVRETPGHRAFQIVNLGTMAVEKETSGLSGQFKRWMSPDWRAETLAIR